MKEVTIKIPEQKLQFFMELMHQLGFVEMQQDSNSVPKAHIEEVRKRKAQLSPEDYQDWDELKVDFGLTK